jgi:hypothetical protein
MENESNLGQPIPTAVLTPTEIIATTDPVAEHAPTQPSVEPAPADALQQPMQLFAEMMFAPIMFWASLSTSYFKLFDMTAKPAAWPRSNW